jgi:hypothetical protein
MIRGVPHCICVVIGSQPWSRYSREMYSYTRASIWSVAWPWALSLTGNSQRTRIWYLYED